jgi:hypothetical protein
MCKVCGKQKSEHVKVLIRESGLGSKVIGAKLKCSTHVGYFKESLKNG